MRTYRVLLVDDEPEIREGISIKIDWGGLGFSLVGEAENGIEALELAEQLMPDVVLTDIKMPFMDGLTLCRKLKQSLPAAKLVVFSGFDEFEYARQAIGIHVSDYILKPINAPELSELLLKLHQQLDTQYRERQDIEALRKRYEESRPMLRELFYIRLLDGTIPQEQLAKQAEWYGVELSNRTWIAGMLRVSRSSSAVEDVQLLSVRDFLAEHMALEGCQVRGVMYNGAVALLAALEEDDSFYPFVQELERVCVMAENFLGVRITAGVGSPCKDPGALHASMEGAKSALEYSALTESRVIAIDDLEPNRAPDVRLDLRDQEVLISAVKFGSEQQIRSAVAAIVEKIKESRFSLSQCHLYFLETVITLVSVIRSSGVEGEAVFGDRFSGLMQIGDFSTLEELETWLVDRALKLRAMMGSKRTSSNWKTMEWTKAQIHEHYADSQLSLEQISAKLRLSPAYFSTLFKKEMGTSFTNYVTKVRMEKAAQLLRNSDDKTYQIAEKIGYADPNYFSYVFKRYFGITPSKFRSAQRGG